MKPDVFHYLDYRKYLKDYYESQKREKRNFSHRYFARLAKLKTSSHLHLVIQGKRGLTATSIQQFAKAIGFLKKEAIYFENLVFFNQAKNDEERDMYFERLLASKPRVKYQGLEKDRYEYYTKEYYVILREMVALPDFQEDPRWIADRIQMPLTPAEVEHSINVLLRLGLIKRDQDGVLKHSEVTVATAPEVESLEVCNFQRKMLNMAKDSLINTSYKMRNLSSMTVPIPLGSIPELKHKIEDFQKEIASFINRGSKDYSEVYQMNIQLFPVTKTKKS